MPPKKAKSKRSTRQRRRTSRRGGDGNFSEGDQRTVMRGLPGGFSSVRLRTVAQADTMVVRLRYETTSAFTSTGGAASYVQLKGNSIYRPYSGNTDSVGGYSRMYADYTYAQVLKSTVTVRLWGGVAGQDEPFRIVLLPCTSTQYSVYSAFTNIAQLWDVPHARQVLFSPGGKLPVLRSSAATQQVYFGNSTERGQEFAAGGITGYGAATGLDPTTLWYWLIGYQNMAGTTTTNQQAQVQIEYDVRFIQPVSTPVQVTKHGNEIVEPAEMKEIKKAASVGAETLPDKLREREAEAFEEWTELDSSYARFLEAAHQARKRHARAENKLSEIKSQLPSAKSEQLVSAAADTQATMQSILDSASELYAATAGGAGLDLSRKLTAAQLAPGLTVKKSP